MTDERIDFESYAAIALRAVRVFSELGPSLQLELLTEGPDELVVEWFVDVICASFSTDALADAGWPVESRVVTREPGDPGPMFAGEEAARGV